MHEYQLKINNENFTVYNKDFIEEKELLKLIEFVSNRLEEVDYEDFPYEVIRLLGSYDFIYPDWCAYEYTVELNFKNKKEFKRELNEKIYTIKQNRI